MKNLMKSLIIATLAAIAIALPMSAKQKSGAVITFAETTHDFGYIQESGGAVSHEFTFTNTGNKPLIIVSAHASCGCTKPEFPKNPIEPGKTGVIKITYKPKNRPGAFDKIVSVTSNAKTVHLRIRGCVISATSTK
ncbi:MAG: DUF1573 domain-containing protein [Candidatus Limisoma sp.]